MKINKLFLAIFAMASALTAGAVNINLAAAGSLEKAITDAPASVTTLTLTGSMNAADFDFINNKMSGLTTLDLSGVTIEAYSGDEVLLNRKEFAADYLPDFALAGTTLRSVVLPASLKVIGEGALSSSAITAISFPASVTTIGDGAFSNCCNLKNVELPATVKSIGAHVFSHCSSLESVTLSCDIPSQAFMGCLALSTVNIPADNKVTVISDKAFMDCGSLITFPFRSQLTQLGESAFERSGLEVADLSSATSLKEMGAWAFAKCPNLTTVIFSPGTTTLGEGLFFEDAALATVALPTGVTELPDYIFKGATAVDSAAFMHDFITSIGNYATKDMSQFTVFHLPASLRYIGNEGMAGWTSIKNINAEGLNEVPKLGTDVFKGIDQPNVGLMVQQDVESDFRSAPQWQEFKIVGTTGLDDIVTDMPVDNRVKAWFEGTLLNLRADREIRLVNIYTLNGVQCLAASPYDEAFVFDTARFTDRLYLLRIELTDGAVITLKISR